MSRRFMVWGKGNTSKIRKFKYNFLGN